MINGIIADLHKNQKAGLYRLFQFIKKVRSLYQLHGSHHW